MKKYVLLFSATIIMVLSINILANYLKNTIVNVDVQLIEKECVEDIIVCSGKIEYMDSQDIYADFSAITDSVNVSVGDVVNKGDLLMSVSEAELAENYKSAMLNQGLPSSLGLNSNTDIAGLYKSILDDSTAKEVFSSSNKGNIDYTKTGKKQDIKAPFTGVVSSINTEAKDVYGKEKSLMVISDNSKFQVHMSVNESKIGDIKLGQKVIITGVGFKDSEYVGVVSRISNEAQQVVNTTGKETVVDVYVTVNETSCNNIKAGLTAKCQIVTSEKPDSTIVPYKSVLSEDDGREFVYSLIDGKAVKTYITTGSEYSRGFEVLDGIEAGSVVITNPEDVSNLCKVNVSKQKDVIS